jgi:CheY-like chemotaxis protein
MSRMMIKTIITTHYPDWEVVEAGDGPEALQVTESTSIDLMTLDMNMPGMDGVTLGLELRKRFPDADIALVTANIQDAVRERAKAAHMIFVPKPITEERIVGFISSVL